MEQSSDKELFAAIATGDEQAFARLFYRYAPALHSYVLGMVKQEALAGEMVQEVFLRVWLKRDTLPSIDQPAAWIYRIASNLSLTQFRRSQLERNMLKVIGQRQAAGTASLTEELNARELNRLIREAMEQLPPQRKKIFTLIREEGRSRREVAGMLGISENTVRNQLGISVKAVQDYILNHTGMYLPFVLVVLSNITRH